MLPPIFFLNTPAVIDIICYNLQSYRIYFVQVVSISQKQPLYVCLELIVSLLLSESPLLLLSL